MALLQVPASGPAQLMSRPPADGWWRADSSSASTVLPTDRTGQSPDTGHDNVRRQPHTEVAAKTGIFVVSDPTAPQRHSTPAGLWFDSPGCQTRGWLLASSSDVRRSGIQHGCR
jgi:hypothetical protein